jgi:hypothetical protein
MPMPTVRIDNKATRQTRQGLLTTGDYLLPWIASGWPPGNPAFIGGKIPTYIPSIIPFSVPLGRIAAAHFASSGQ